MLLQFQLTNWACYGEKVSFAMTGTRERQNLDRVPRLGGKYGDTKVLPISVIFGANASGKSKLIEAIAFAKRFILDGVHMDATIPVNPCRSSKELMNQPSRFSFVIYASDDLYRFEFAVTATHIEAESLCRMTKSRDEVVYRRETDKLIELSEKLPDQEFLRFAFQGTRSNQLFLTNAVNQKVEVFRPIYDWFRNTLEIITSDSQYVAADKFFRLGDPLHDQLEKALKELDTGISGVVGIHVDSSVFTDRDRMELARAIKEGEFRPFRMGKEIFVATKVEGVLKIERMGTKHSMRDGSENIFDLTMESDGSLRMMDLLPVFVSLRYESSHKVYLIDELDRSLHPKLVDYLVRSYLSDVDKNSRTQVIFSTHNLGLMDQKILRRDEMWAIDRNTPAGDSQLIAFSDFIRDVRYDKDIRKCYLQGRMGGIPNVPFVPSVKR